MNIDTSSLLPAITGARLTPTADAGAGAGANALGFAQWLERSLAETNTKLNAADQQVQRLALGETDNLHHVMISLEEAKLSFQLMVQVRNKLLEAYQDILRMQV
jgi:flagellar hook-basal body complex protein FliE